MKISFSATNPCHLYPLAVELAQLGALGCYYSGYPAWKLPELPPGNIRAHSFRTNVVYGLLKYLPERLRPDSRSLFLWQDDGFDRWAGKALQACNFVHGMPGQCLHLFRAARKLRVKTVLNHATGPVRDWVEIMRPEYARVGLDVHKVSRYDDAYFKREDEEYALSDYHCAASTVVRDQLLTRGIAPERIWVIPYGADPRWFFPNESAPDAFRILFAGQLTLRKGLKAIFEALELADRKEWRLDLYGPRLAEAEHDIAAYSGSTPLHFHGAVPQMTLGEAMRAASLLVLPSLEEGFGLVVPQALNCGTPVIVSDRTGGKDLVKHRENGSIIPAQDPGALAAELAWWEAHPKRVNGQFHWTEPARQLLAMSEASNK